MKARRAVLAAVLAVPAREVPAMMMDQQQRSVPPPMRDFRRGRTSETHTATQLERNWSVEEMAVRPKGSDWPMSSK
jgi:hypothetical protein